jgi:cyclase
MRRLALVALAVAPLATRAQQLPDFDKVQIKVHPVAGAIYMLEGAGGNIAVSAGDDGLVVVDDQYAPLAEKIRAALKGISDKPVRFVINTHWHGDHVGGNAAMAGNGATLIAQDNVRKRMTAGGQPGNLGTLKLNEVRPYQPIALPVITFASDVTVHLNGEDVRALHIGPGHTDGDSIIFFTRSNVVHMGDDFVNGLPFVDLGSGGSVKGLIQTVETAIPKIPPDAKIIPGHGPLSTLDDLKKYLQMVKDTVAAVEQGVRAGKSLEQLQKEKVLARWENQKRSFMNIDLYTESVYNELSGKKVGMNVPTPKH